jgi:hypothetical protein
VIPFRRGVSETSGEERSDEAVASQQRFILGKTLFYVRNLVKSLTLRHTNLKFYVPFSSVKAYSFSYVWIEPVSCSQG